MKRLRRYVVPNESAQYTLRRLCLGVSLLFMLSIAAPEASANDCRLSLSQPRVDHGVLRRAELLGEPLASQPIILGRRTLQLSVVCAEPGAVALRFTGVPAGTQGYRFGRQGSFTLALKHAQVDGRAVELSTSQPTETATSGHLLPGHVLIAKAGGLPLTGTRFSAQVQIDTYLPPDAFSVRHETVFEGQGHFEWLPGG